MSSFKSRTNRILNICSSMCSAVITSGSSDDGSLKVDEQKANVKKINQIREFQTIKTDVWNESKDNNCQYTDLNNLSASNIIEEAVSHDILLIDDSSKSLDDGLQLNSNIGILNNDYSQYNDIDLNIQDNSFNHLLLSSAELPHNISNISIELNIGVPASTSEENNIDENITSVLQEQTNIIQEDLSAVFDGKPNVSNNTEEQVDRKKEIPKKRKRNENEWKKNIRKHLRNRGEEYTSVKGKTVNAKSYRFFICKCNFNCENNFTDKTRRDIHSRFYNLKNWELQTLFIQSAIKVCPVGRKRTEKEISRRACTRKYFLKDSENHEKEVCKNVFKHTLRLSDQRIAYAIAKGSPEDQRGKHIPHNKTKTESLELIRNFIQNFPAYQSHYSRNKNPNRLYLSPTLNKAIMYNLYLEHCKVQEPKIKPEESYIFRKVFNEDFNLHFHPPQKDTCKTCNTLKNKIEYCVNEDEKNKLTEDLNDHHVLAEKARLTLNTDQYYSKSDDFNTIVICFDLMKTLPTPDLDVNIVYYKRQLWTYLLGIHNLTTEEVFMYLWHEGLASRT
uniref:Uncharacterized protein LOC114345401 n=1 Tax=Diabrotica virgifera virgifera TaxID=50390 RepID=A0A6P7GQ38_DIAVI